MVFVRNVFLRLVRAPNQSLIHIIIYYIFKYSIGIKTTLLVSLRSQKSILKAIFEQNDFLRLFGAPNESLILIIIYYMFKYSVGIKTTLLVTSDPKKYFKSYISAKLVIRT